MKINELSIEIKNRKISTKLMKIKANITEQNKQKNPNRICEYAQKLFYEKIDTPLNRLIKKEGTMSKYTTFEKLH